MYLAINVVFAFKSKKPETSRGGGEWHSNQKPDAQCGTEYPDNRAVQPGKGAPTPPVFSPTECGCSRVVPSPRGAPSRANGSRTKNADTDNGCWHFALTI